MGGKESVLSESVTYYRKSHALSAYDIAVLNGFEGTQEEWLASLVGTDGSDGTGIDTAQINEAGELILFLTDGAQINLGTVAGAAGEAGVGIASVYLNADGELQVLLTGGTQMNLGVVVGQDGLDGTDGITPLLRINPETGHWEVSLDEGHTWESTGVNATGEKGDKGDQGAPGVGVESVTLDEESSDDTMSVYVITLTDGSAYPFTVYHGTDGEDGAKGDSGADGITPQFRINEDTNEWEVSLDEGETWTSTGVVATGDKGDKGDPGEQGETGVGIRSMAFDENGNLIVTLTDGTIQNLGRVPYPDQGEGTHKEDERFVDVDQTKFFYDAVVWAYDNDITQGVDATHFNPGGDCTRAQIATFLWRAAGSPEPVSEEHPFTDIKADSYYYKAVLWAVEEGITNGTSASTFSPNTNCTRSQVATFLWRAELEPSVSDPDNPFTDLREDAYYYDAVLWAVEEGVTNGVGGGRFAPDESCTRGQIATFLYRALG